MAVMQSMAVSVVAVLVEGACINFIQLGVAVVVYIWEQLDDHVNNRPAIAVINDAIHCRKSSRRWLILIPYDCVKRLNDLMLSYSSASSRRREIGCKFYFRLI